MKTYKQIIEESMASKLVQTKLGNMERMRSVEIPSHEERRAQMEKRKKDAEAAAAAKAQKTSLKESDDIADYSLDELHEFLVSEEFEQLDELVDYSKMSVQTLNKHLTNHKLKYAQTKSHKHLSQIGTIKDVIQSKLKEEEDEYNITDFSLEELQEYIVSEEFEQLDELSKTSLKSYIKKASNDAIGHSYHAGTHSYSDEKKDDELYSKARKRFVGIKRATDKL